MFGHYNLKYYNKTFGFYIRNRLIFLGCKKTQALDLVVPGSQSLFAKCYFVYWWHNAIWDSYFTVAAMPQQQCYSSSATASVQQQHCYKTIATAAVLQHQCNSGIATTAVVQQQCCNNSAITALSKLQCNKCSNKRSATAAVQQRQCYNCSDTNAATNATAAVLVQKC